MAMKASKTSASDACLVGDEPDTLSCRATPSEADGICERVESGRLVLLAVAEEGWLDVRTIG